MAGIRIDNCSDDGITVIINGRSICLAEGEKKNIDSLKKGIYKIKIHRTRIPQEISEDKINVSDIKGSLEKQSESPHIQLDREAEIEMLSSKTVIAVKSCIKGAEKRGTDTIFSSYSVDVSGGRVVAEREYFAHREIGKKFLHRQIAEAFWPVGLGGIIFMILGITAISANLSGKEINLGGLDFSLPWSVGLTAAGFACFGYFIFAAAETIRHYKKYRENK